MASGGVSAPMSPSAGGSSGTPSRAVIACGHLWKRSVIGRFGKNWRERYIVLFHDRFEYYKSQADWEHKKPPANDFPLSEQSVATVSNVGPFCYQVTGPRGTLVLKAPDDTRLRYWLTALDTLLRQHRQAAAHAAAKAPLPTRSTSSSLSTEVTRTPSASPLTASPAGVASAPIATASSGNGNPSSSPPSTTGVTDAALQRAIADKVAAERLAAETSQKLSEMRAQCNILQSELELSRRHLTQLRAERAALTESLNQANARCTQLTEECQSLQEEAVARTASSSSSVKPARLLQEWSAAPEAFTESFLRHVPALQRRLQSDDTRGGFDWNVAEEEDGQFVIRLALIPVVPRTPAAVAPRRTITSTDVKQFEAAADEMVVDTRRLSMSAADVQALLGNASVVSPVQQSPVAVAPQNLEAKYEEPTQRQLPAPVAEDSHSEAGVDADAAASDGEASNAGPDASFHAESDDGDETEEDAGVSKTIDEEGESGLDGTDTDEDGESGTDSGSASESEEHTPGTSTNGTSTPRSLPAPPANPPRPRPSTRRLAVGRAQKQSPQSVDSDDSSPAHSDAAADQVVMAEVEEVPKLRARNGSLVSSMIEKGLEQLRRAEARGPVRAQSQEFVEPARSSGVRALASMFQQQTVSQSNPISIAKTSRPAPPLPSRAGRAPQQPATPPLSSSPPAI